MSSTTSAPSGDPGGVGGGRIRSLSAAASQEAWEMRKGLDGYCTYRSRAISGTSDAQGAGPHDDASAGIAAGLSAWRGLVSDLSGAIAEADAALGAADASSAASWGLVGGRRE
ncbi:conserved hypothetical protein [Olsenella uli DSM 7084]|uniref:Uncharacterized protein n=2 Tax=Olsenella uli TaxID=133926 RepID=E1QWW6_OLSUV|nr:hypothetical protein [Olsenella uli]ADK68619.1 conserved hypothetical protein [Olsenella uli DSM 7084]